MQKTDIKTNHDDVDEGMNWVFWTGAAVGAAAVLGTAGYLAWRWTRKPTVTQRMRARADQAMKAVKR